MIRALDFTPLPDNNYRYRVRIVVFNPNHNRDDVSPGVDTKSTELFGPWSEPTDEVNMPADVSAYAMGVLPLSPKSDIKVNFQVVRFDPNDRRDDPPQVRRQRRRGHRRGQQRGYPDLRGYGQEDQGLWISTPARSCSTPPEACSPCPRASREVPLERPALTLLLRPDGSVLARTQADDINNEVRKDIERNYDREIKDSSKKRENSMGTGYGGMMGMMGGYGGMMGGGYLGTGGGGRR